MAGLCNRNGCESLGTKHCGACGDVYCSVECQRNDWKFHKRSCININKLPLTFLPLSQIDQYNVKACARMDILATIGNEKEAISLVLKLLAFLENQLGVPIVGTSDYCRRNGDVVDDGMILNSRIELCRLYTSVYDIGCMYSLEVIVENALAARHMLEARNQSDDETLHLLSQIEVNLGGVYHRGVQYSEAEYHGQQSLAFAKLIEGEVGASDKCNALSLLASIRGSSGKHLEAIDFAEQAYVIASDTHGPIHFVVQTSVEDLVRRLIAAGDLSRAEDYCRVNYSNLIDPIYGYNQEGPVVAQGMKLLVHIWLMKPPIEDEEEAFALAEEAEEFMKKACRMINKLYNNDSGTMADYYVTYGRVLMKRCKYTEETRIILEQALTLDKQNSFALRLLIFDYLAEFHGHTSAAMPPGDARDREIRLRDSYRAGTSFNC